ncbi:uncharacterized protein BDR25DRAFT_324301 [Lindgomyces ingoldianus]|uniref:Uncharacterized protein n=1 Tax=Lindgomyces ingoldianus TaxID=673940 RepID=A0ACB6R227_9PLEO|nr:uncharacterized protein BDR25DRAFT_324301 [Lindgomyces ingoldianus]KAF2472385.1 hypothetical protein BDR25DRAFT_324301 [Lindgomyces ingoldianus]
MRNDRFVCSIAHERKEIVRLRRYSLTDETSIPATICQTALVTSAATSYFDPASIVGRRFAAGGLGANNPVDEVEVEASNIWCAETGDLKPLKAIEDNVLGLLSRRVVGITTQTDEAEKRLIAKWRQHLNEKRYFCFSQGAIEAATNEYLSHLAQKFRVRDCVLNLKQKHTSRCIKISLFSGCRQQTLKASSKPT